MLGLDPGDLKADVTVNIPALAPFAAMAGQNVAGSTVLHLLAAEQPDGSARLAVDGDVGLSAGPGGVAKWVGKAGKVSLRAVLRGQRRGYCATLHGRGGVRRRGCGQCRIPPAWP